jgi:hypothetical protein
MHRPGLMCEGLVRLDTKRDGLVFVGLLIFTLICVGPGMAIPPPVSCYEVITLNEGDSIATAVGNVCNGGTIILNPGTYSQNDITISKNITIRANTSYGGTAANTIIDAGGADRIFVKVGLSDFTIASLSLRNGASVTGGAIINADGNLIITGSTIAGCSASQYGGAIDNIDGTVTITGSTISGCTAAYGGAISSENGAVTITGSTIADCPATYGGAINSDRDTVTITGSTISGCSAARGGAIWSYGSTILITGSTIAGCSASQNGGAIYGTWGSAVTIDSSRITGCRTTGGDGGALSTLNGGTVTVRNSSTITGCSASHQGGAIWSDGAVTVAGSSVIDHCTAAGDGGAIYSSGGSVTITGSTFSVCSSGGYGGALLGSGSVVAITDAAFTGCTAVVGGGAIAVAGSGTTSILSSDFEGCLTGAGGGGAVLAFPTTTIHFSRFHGNDATTSPGTAVRFVSTFSDATANWWGSNSGPGAAYAGDPAAVASWLVLGATAEPAAIITTGTSAIRFNLTFDSDGNAHNPAGGHVPDRIPGTWAVVAGSGTVFPSAGTTTDGVNTTQFTPSGTGSTNISATVDGQTVYISVAVSPVPAPPVVTLDTSNNDNGFPSGAVAPAVTGEGNPPPMTVTVNIGGDSKAWQAVVTGTKLSDLIVTGTEQHGLAGNQTAPPGTVFQYISLAPARYGTVANAVIYFTIPQAWLDANHINPKSIVLYHQTANGWEALPTTVVSTKDGTVYFSAQSTGFSLFAIAGTPTVATPATVATTQAVTGSMVQTPAPVAVTKVPATTQTTAPPTATPQPAAPSPLVNIVLAIVAIGILAGGGFIARRWWIRRQNPVLFREYD